MVWYANPIMFIDPSGMTTTGLREWVDFTSINFDTNMVWNAKTKTATVTVSNKGSATGTIVSFTAGVGGTYIGADGKMYVDGYALHPFYENIIDPPIHVYDEPKDILNMAIGITAIIKGSGLINKASGKIAYGEATLLAGTTMRERLMNTVQNPNLQKIVDSIYLKSASTGDGGTADMLKYEFLNGQPLRHLQKATEQIIRLENFILSSAGKLEFNDLFIAEQLINELRAVVNLVTK